MSELDDILMELDGGFELPSDTPTDTATDAAQPGADGDGDGDGERDGDRDGDRDRKRPAPAADADANADTDSDTMGTKKAKRQAKRDQAAELWDPSVAHPPHPTLPSQHPSENGTRGRLLEVCVAVESRPCGRASRQLALLASVL